MFCILKMRKCILPTFQNITQIVKTIYLFNNSKRRRIALSCRRKIISIIERNNFKNKGDFYCLVCLNSLRTKKNLNRTHKKVCENKDCCNIVMPSEETKKSEFNQYHKFDKVPFIIYADLECLIEKIDRCKNNRGNSCTTKVCEHVPSGFSMSTTFSFRGLENKHDVCKDTIV